MKPERELHRSKRWRLHRSLPALWFATRSEELLRDIDRYVPVARPEESLVRRCVPQVHRSLLQRVLPQPPSIMRARSLSGERCSEPVPGVSVWAWGFFLRSINIRRTTPQLTAESAMLNTGHQFRLYPKSRKSTTRP